MDPKVDVDSGLSADAARDTASDRCWWRAQRPPLVIAYMMTMLVFHPKGTGEKGMGL